MCPSGNEGRLQSQRSGVQVKVRAKFKNKSGRGWLGVELGLGGLVHV